MVEVNNIYGRIYKITSEATNEEYIGSTTQTLKQRLAEHTSKYLTFNNKSPHDKYYTSFEILQHGDAKISVHYEGVLDNKKELKQMEGKLIRETPSCVNKYIPGRTQKQYRQDNEEHIKDMRRNYYARNKEHIAEQIKQYKENNYEWYVEYHKKYKQENKERLLNKHVCSFCGGKYATKHKTTHEKTKKHLLAVENIKSQ